MNKLTVLMLSVAFIIINSVTYCCTNMQEEVLIDTMIKEKMKSVETHYEILQLSQTGISEAIFNSIMRNRDVRKVLLETYGKDDTVKEKARLYLTHDLMSQYNSAKTQGILQLQVVDRDNISFLRMHKPDKFGDDLTDVRNDFNIVKTSHKKVKGFTQGRTSHGFRNIFPIFHEGEYIGAIEISFSSENLEFYLNKVSKIHTHFLIDKNVFAVKLWDSQEFIQQYIESDENPDFVRALPFNNNHITKELFLNKQQKQYIVENMLRQKKFNIYVFSEDHKVLSFIPVKNESTKVIAWVVSYQIEPMIGVIKQNKINMDLIIFLLSIFIIYFIYNRMRFINDIENIAFFDKLTGIYNRYKFDELFEIELKSAKRYSTPVSIAVLDIDNFKRFNDIHGHLMGDKVLVNVAKIIKNTLRETDLYARWGGEEFVIVFRNTKAIDAFKVAEKLRLSIQELTKGNHKVEVSIGVTDFNNDTFETIFNRCDQALYESKNNGRNRTTLI